MYSYNSTHKVVIAVIVVIWAVYNFSQRDDKGLYYENGQIKRSGITDKSMNEGMWVWYFEDGSTQMKGKFHNGKREGIWESFDKKGKLISTSTYSDNKLNGTYIEYNSKGKVIRIIETTNKNITKMMKRIEVTAKTS